MSTQTRINRSDGSSADKRLLRQLFAATPTNAEAIQRTVRQPSSFGRDDRRALVTLATLFQATGGDIPAAKDRAATIINDMSCGANIKRMLRREFSLLS